MRYLLLLAALMMVFVGCNKQSGDPNKTEKKTPKTTTEKKVPVKSPETTRKEVNQASKLIKLLPDGVDFMVKFSSLETIYSVTALNGSSIFGIPMDEFKEVADALGFNPFEAKELAAKGVNLKGELALFGHGLTYDAAREDLTSLDIYLAIPVTNGEQVLAYISSKMKEKGEKFTVEKRKDGVTVFKGDEPRKQIFFLQKPGYLMIGANPVGDPKPFLAKLLGGKTTLDQQKSFLKLASHLDTAEDAVLYINMKGMLDRNMKQIDDMLKREFGAQASIFKKQLEMVQDYDQAMITASLSKPDLMIRSGISVVSGSNLLALMRDVAIDKSVVLGLSEQPIWLISFGLNPETYYKMISEMLAGMMNLDEMILKGNKALGIDIKKELIQNLSGSFSGGMYDGKSIAMGNFNGLFSIGVKDPRIAAKTMEALMKLVPEQFKKSVTISDVLSYELTLPMAKIYLGIKGNNVISAMGKPYYEKALKAAPANGFIKDVKDPYLKKTLSAKGSSIFYGSVDQGIKMATALNPKMMDDQAKLVEQIKQVHYLLIDASISGELFFSNITVKTGFKKPFITSILDIVKMVGF